MEPELRYSYERHKALKAKFYPSRPVVPVRPQEKRPDLPAQPKEKKPIWVVSPATSSYEQTFSPQDILLDVLQSEQTGPEKPYVRDIINLTPNTPKEEARVSSLLRDVWSVIQTDEDFMRQTHQIMKGFSGRPSARIVIAKTLVKHNMTFVDVAGQARSKKYIACRHEIYYRLRSELGLSLMQVGRMLNRDHTTILHGFRKMEEKIANGFKLD
jgi:hypothetical protein